MNKIIQKNKSIEACKILNEINVDLEIGVECIENFNVEFKNKKFDKIGAISRSRLCLFHIFLALYKLMEFYNKYKQNLPYKTKSEFKELFKALRQKKVNVFRNKYIGHIWDTDTGKPLTFDRIDEYVKIIMGQKHQDFIRWISLNKENTFPSTVTSIIQMTIDEIMAENDINENDLFEN